MNGINLTLGIISLVFLFTILVLVIAWRRRGIRIEQVVRQQTEIDHFLDLFSRSLRSNDELSDSMHQAAKHIAEMIMAESVCIYRIEGDTLQVSGVSGCYPLSQLTIMMDPDAGEDIYRKILRDEEITIGEGFIGRTAARRRSILLPEARHDEHLSEFPMERLPEQVMAVPVFRGEQLSGVICAAANTNWCVFNAAKLAQLQFSAAQVRLIQDLEDSYKVRSAQERLNQELGFARKLQASLLPEIGRAHV